MDFAADAFSLRLESDGVVVLTPEEMETLLGHVEVVRKYVTLGKGDLIVAKWCGTPVVFEQPETDRFTARRFADQTELNRFVERRLDQYERMWDGCGCRIDFYEQL